MAVQLPRFGGVCLQAFRQFALHADEFATRVFTLVQPVGVRYAQAIVLGPIDDRLHKLGLSHGATLGLWYWAATKGVNDPAHLPGGRGER